MGVCQSKKLEKKLQLQVKSQLIKNKKINELVELNTNLQKKIIEIENQSINKGKPLSETVNLMI